jgi:hypothetical protein
MKKILLAFDGVHFSEGAFAFAKWMNSVQPVMLTAAFLPQSDYANLWSYAAQPAGEGEFIPLLEEAAAQEVKRNIERFKKNCTDQHINYSIHRDFNDFTLPELKKETRYADLLILGAESFYADAGPDAPNAFLSEALHQSECAVMVVPETFSVPTSNIIAFDGSASSVYAIKQFAALFPALCNNETLLVHAGNNADESLPDQENIKELTSVYFPRLTILTMDINPGKYFAAWVKDHTNALVVTGAYGRSSLSQLFRKSFVSGMIKDHSLPVFITHR